MGKPKFKVNDLIKYECKLMKDTWFAKVVEVLSVEGSARPGESGFLEPIDGFCYVTIGWWGKENRKKKPTSMQLYAQDISKF